MALSPDSLIHANIDHYIIRATASHVQEQQNTWPSRSNRRWLGTTLLLKSRQGYHPPQPPVLIDSPAATRGAALAWGAMPLASGSFSPSVAAPASAFSSMRPV